MAIDWADGFDHYGTGNGLAVFTQGTYAWASQGFMGVAAGGRTGNYLWTRTTGAEARRLFRGPRVEGGISTAWRISSIPSTTGNRGGIQLRSSSNAAQLTLIVGINGQLQLIRGATGGTLLSESSPGIFSPNAWNHVEIKYLISTTVGYAIVRLNKTVVIEVYGVNTQATGEANTQSLVVFQGSGGGTNPEQHFDDMVVWDTTGPDNNDFLGDVRVFTRPPIANGDSSSFIPSAGTNYQCVDDIPPNDSDYVSGQTPGTIDLYTHGGLPGGFNGSIKGICVITRGLKEDAGAAKYRHVIKSGDDLSTSANFTPTTSAGYFGNVFEISPNTGNPFVVSETNTIQFGQEVVEP